MTLSELVEIKEEFFNSDSLHNDSMLESILNIIWVVGHLDSLLHESVVDDVQTLSVGIEVSITCGSQLAVMEWIFWFWVLVNILDEDVLWSVNISTELEIVDLSDVSSVEIFPDQNLEELLLWWDQIQFLHDTSELLNSDVAAVGPVIILELRLDQDSLLDNFSLDSVQKVEEALHLFLIEVG